MKVSGAEGPSAPANLSSYPKGRARVGRRIVRFGGDIS